MDVTCEIVIDASIGTVFSYYADQNRLQEWVAGGGILEFTPLTPPPKKLGSVYRMAYRSLGMTFHLNTELTALEMNHRSAMDQVAGDYESFHYEMLFTPLSSHKTRVSMRIRAVLPWGWLGELMDRLSQPFARRDIEGALRRLKSSVERPSQTRS
jgi:uncharacterized membrane protein